MTNPFPHKLISTQIKERLYHREPVFSFEFFPPKTEKGERILTRALDRLSPFNPSFVSVTYGAGGGTRERTREIVRSIKNKHGIDAMAHLTCVGHSHHELSALLDDYHQAGIRNILALRGDPPKDDSGWGLVPDGPQHAIEIVEMAKDRFCVGVAGFPEIHPDAPDMETDLKYLREKVDAGAEFIITQLFFSNDLYFDYVTQARRLGIKVPIIPGIMPITKQGQIEKFKEMCGCQIPKRLVAHLNECGDDTTRIQELGLAYCAAQCVDLLRRGAPGIHLYTLNKSRACQTVYATLHAMGLWVS